MTIRDLIRYITGTFLIITIGFMGITLLFLFVMSFYYSTIYDSSCLETIAENYCKENNMAFNFMKSDCCPDFKFECEYQENNKHIEPVIKKFIFTKEELRYCGVET